MSKEKIDFLENNENNHNFCGSNERGENKFVKE